MGSMTWLLRKVAGRERKDRTERMERTDGKDGKDRTKMVRVW